LLRATGVTDVLTFAEPRLPGYVAHFYGPQSSGPQSSGPQSSGPQSSGTAPAQASREQIEHIAEGWRPYRTWAAVLIRTAGDRQGLPLAA
jgi:3-methyladenine DNA glycosylase/8-oxoguanine DNA glycosylase